MYENEFLTMKLSSKKNHNGDFFLKLLFALVSIQT